MSYEEIYPFLSTQVSSEYWSLVVNVNLNINSLSLKTTLMLNLLIRVRVLVLVLVLGLVLVLVLVLGIALQPTRSQFKSLLKIFGVAHKRVRI